MDIKVERLKVQFGDREILKNISLDFPKQKFTGIIGPNGSGKSTISNVYIAYWSLTAVLSI